MKPEFIDKLVKLEIEFEINKPLASYTTWKIGGPGELVIVASDSQQIIDVYNLCKEYEIRFTILGGGSNILINDEGIKGVVVINKTKHIEILDTNDSGDIITKDESEVYDMYVEPRHGEAGSDFYTFDDLDYEEKGPTTNVKFDSGVVVSYAIAWGLKNSLTGIQWFAGIPGTVGGALYNNIHGGTRHFSDRFVSATIVDSKGIREVGRDYFDFAYDQSELRKNKDVVVLNVTLSMFTEEDVDKAKYVAQEWARRKRVQPRISCGCIFQNITEEDKERNGFDSPSVGYIVDKKLGWAGKREGEAEISTKHAAFIENTGEAKSEDVLKLLRAVKSEIKQRYDIDLVPEINILGYDQETRKEILGHE